MERVLLACALVVVVTHPAFAWGPLGHEAIGEAAQSALTTQAHEGLAKVFGHGTTLAPGTLAKIATWPDDVRARMVSGAVAPGWDQSDIKEADRFNHDHKDNALWHFVNLPLGAESYPTATSPPSDPARPFVRPDDVAQIIKRCIAILESPGPTPHFTRVQAVRWLVHLAGDIHQPLHVTAGYYRSSGNLAQPRLIRDPVAAAEPGVVGDHGGNGLLFSPTIKLHGVWDGCLVEIAAGKTCSGKVTEYTPLAHKLAARMATPEGGALKSTGDHHHWPEQWATDSLKLAAKPGTYPTILKNGKVQSTHGGEELYMQATIVSPASASYVDARAPAAADQLLKAAVRLANVLNAIAWP